jgi:hypothetical protein
VRLARTPAEIKHAFEVGLRIDKLEARDAGPSPAGAVVSINAAEEQLDVVDGWVAEDGLDGCASTKGHTQAWKHFPPCADR